LPVRIALAPGKHRIVAGARGYRGKVAEIQVRPGRPLALAYRLEPIPARLRLWGAGRRTPVYLDGKLFAVGPATKVVAPGWHKVTARRKGYRYYQRRLHLAPGQSRSFRVGLAPRWGRIAVGSVPAGGTVLLDGRRQGATPRVLWARPGRHTLALSRRGYQGAVRRVRLAPGGSLTVKPRLAPKQPPVPGYEAPLPRRPLAVMVENHPDARPQSGLDYADVVLEAPAEFGISRFVAFFITREAPVVGPVRSARKYFVLWAREFNPVYFHAGGAPGAAALAQELGMARTNALWDSRAFYRTNDRIAPHNLYTSTRALVRTERAKGRGFKSGTWGGLRFKRPGTELGPEKAAYARLVFNQWYYVEWRWDPSHGMYRRWMDGRPAIERNTGAQITATAVVVRVHDVRRVPGDDKAREDIRVLGSGKAYVLQDGRLTRATWRKRGVYTPTLYYDSRGRRIAFNKGGVWIQVIPQYGSVSFR
jgi:hypothetical protein